MTTYTAIPDSDIDPDSPVTSSLMTLLRDNPIAITEGSAGAPNIQTAAYTAASVDQAAIGPSAVGQSELKSTTASQTVSVPNNGGGTVSLTGGSYTMFITAGVQATAGANDLANSMIGSLHSDGAVATKVGFSNNSIGGAETVYVYSRYVQASPPWNHGNGDIALFVIIMRDKKTHEILGIYIAEDPPWAYHGTHDLHPIIGKLQKKVGIWGMDTEKILLAGPSKELEIIEQGCVDIDEIIKTGKIAEAIDGIEFSMEEKMCDCDKAPHLFHGFDSSKHEIIMIDPVSDFCDRLGALNSVYGHKARIVQDIESGDIVLGVTVGAKSPKGIIPVSARRR